MTISDHYENAFDEISLGVYSVSGECSDEVKGIVKSIKFDLLRLAGSTREAAKYMCQSLSKTDWNWKQSGNGEANDGITKKASQELPMESKAKIALNSLTIPVLLNLCNKYGIGKIKNKQSIINSLVNASGSNPDLTNEIISIFDIEIERQIRKNHTSIAEAFITRISITAYGRHQHAELFNTLPEYDFSRKIRPNIRFHAAVAGFEEIPNKCKKFDGKVLPRDQAEKLFPKIPCGNPDCRCRISSEK
jgi:hypothetical protein